MKIQYTKVRKILKIKGVFAKSTIFHRLSEVKTKKSFALKKKELCIRWVESMFEIAFDGFKSTFNI
jgi:hypothetical protein